MNKNDLRKVRDLIERHWTPATQSRLDAKREVGKILDAALAADPQPVGEYLGTKKDDCGEREECVTWDPLEVGTSLYASPVAAQQREWQSLNDEQVEAIVRTKGDELMDHVYEYGTIAEGTDEKLKAIVHAADICLRAKNEEKNHG